MFEHAATVPAGCAQQHSGCQRQAQCSDGTEARRRQAALCPRGRDPCSRQTANINTPPPQSPAPIPIPYLQAHGALHLAVLHAAILIQHAADLLLHSNEHRVAGRWRPRHRRCGGQGRSGHEIGRAVGCVAGARSCVGDLTSSCSPQSRTANACAAPRPLAAHAAYTRLQPLHQAALRAARQGAPCPPAAAAAEVTSSTASPSALSDSRKSRPAALDLPSCGRAGSGQAAGKGCTASSHGGLVLGLRPLGPGRSQLSRAEVDEPLCLSTWYTVAGTSWLMD